MVRACAVFITLGLAASAASGCASYLPTRCYVALDESGQPRAEACETGAEIRVRPITPENAAFYAPPYILGALAYEGYVAPAGEGDADFDAPEPADAAGFEPVADPAAGFAIDGERVYERGAGAEDPPYWGWVFNGL